MKRLTMSPKEAARRIREHNDIHAKKEYPNAVLITEALNMAVEMLELGLSPKRCAELAKADQEGLLVELLKEAHQPMLVKQDAIDTFDKWNDTTGAIPNGTSWYYEAQGVIEEIVAMAFGAGIFYEAEKALEENK